MNVSREKMGALLILALSIAYGVYAGLFLAPMDYQQGDAFRIIYVHVPSAFISLSIWLSLIAVARMRRAHRRQNALSAAFVRAQHARDHGKGRATGLYDVKA